MLSRSPGHDAGHQPPPLWGEPALGSARGHGVDRDKREAVEISNLRSSEVIIIRCQESSSVTHRHHDCPEVRADGPVGAGVANTRDDDYIIHILIIQSVLS